MTELSVTERPTRRASELSPGDWIRNEDEQEVEGLQVEYVSKYVDAVQNSRVLVVYRRPDAPAPETMRYGADFEVDLLTDAEIEGELALRRRVRLADQLQHVAAMLVDAKLPVGPDYAVARLHIQLPAVADLTPVAEALGLEVESSGSYSTVVWPPARPGVVDCPLQVTWSAYASSIADDPLGLGFSREAEPAIGTAPVPAYVQGEAMTGREVAAEHFQTSGWTGGDDGAGVACACGVQFDGFSSMAEAHVLLKQHIADEASR